MIKHYSATIDSPSIRHVCAGLTTFANLHPDIAASLLGATLPPERFAPELMGRLDAFLHRDRPDRELARLADAFDALLNGPLWHGFLRCALRDARVVTIDRIQRGRMRSVWGTTPIINVISCCAAERLLGCESETLVFEPYYITSSFDIVLGPSERWFRDHDPFRLIAFRWLVFLWALMRYDSFHYFSDAGILPAGGYGKGTFGINEEEMQLIRATGKSLYTMAYGADYRTRTKTIRSGRWNFCLECPEVGRFCLCDDATGERIFAAIARHATAVLGAGLSLAYLPNPYDLDYLILDTSAIVPVVSTPALNRPLTVVHVPNHPHFKGTRFLEAAVARLKGDGYCIELVLLSGVSHEQVLAVLKSADIVADQFIGGSFGQTAIEAMALGKPVLCFVRDDRPVPERSQFPIINTNPDSLYETLKKFCDAPELLPEIGLKSRHYVEQHYSLDAFARRLAEVYAQVSPFPTPSERGVAGFGRRLKFCMHGYVPVAIWRARNTAGRCRNILFNNKIYPAVRRAIRGVRTTLARIAQAALGLPRAARQLFEDFRNGVAHPWTSTSKFICGMPSRLSGAARSSITELRNVSISSRQNIVNRIVLSRARTQAGWRGRSAQARFAVIRWSRRAFHAALPYFIAPLILAARASTAWRLHIGTPRTLWGITPILTLPLLARSDRALGLGSDSLVFTTYHTVSQFDICLKRVSDYMIVNQPYLYRMFTRLVLVYALLRYDVFHFFCDRSILLPDPGPMGINEHEMDLLRRCGKRLFAYTYGADVRTRQATLNLGQLNFCMDCPEPGRLCVCDDARGRRNIATIRRYAHGMMAMGDMKAYVDDCIDLHFWPLDTQRFQAAPARPRDGVLRVAHAPNHPHFKGTRHLVEAIERLKSEGRSIEMVKVQGVPNEQVLELFRNCDVVAEQFIGGFHGYTALEAMALGRPVLVYIRSPDLLIDPATCPLINTTPETLYDVLRDMLDGKYDLEEIGRRGRAYIERYYSIEAISTRLAKVYCDSGRFPARIQRRIAKRAAELEPDVSRPRLTGSEVAA